MPNRDTNQVLDNLSKTLLLTIYAVFGSMKIRSTRTFLEPDFAREYATQHRANSFPFLHHLFCRRILSRSEIRFNDSISTIQFLYKNQTELSQKMDIFLLLLVDVTTENNICCGARNTKTAQFKPFMCTLMFFQFHASIRL